jgi:hypothetical protein
LPFECPHFFLSQLAHCLERLGWLFFSWQTTLYATVSDTTMCRLLLQLNITLRRILWHLGQCSYYVRGWMTEESWFDSRLIQVFFSSP